MDLHQRSKPGGVRHDGEGSVAERREGGPSTEASLAKMPPVSQHYEYSNIGDQARVHFGNQYGDQHHYHYATKVEGLGKDVSASNLLQHLRESLSFPQMNYRFTTIKKPLPQTGSWFVKTPQYTQWRDKELRHFHRGLLWLKGMPGSGKSTIIKSVLEHAKTMYPAEETLYFFFDGRGATLGNSIEGMFRSLLHQIAPHVPWLARAVPPEEMIMYGNGSWPLDLLTILFRESICHSRPDSQITLYVDAMDECDDEIRVRDMIDLLEEILEAEYPENPKLSVFLASRHHPNIDVACSVSLVLEMEEHHHQDIAHYVQKKLKCKQEFLRGELLAEITRRACGLFLWVVLTVKALNTECDRGNHQSLKSLLTTTPRGLDDLITSIIRKGALDERLFPSLQWVTYANRPLRPEELYVAIRTATSSLSHKSVIHQKAMAGDTVISNFILSSSKGLLDIVYEPGLPQEKLVRLRHGSIKPEMIFQSTSQHDNLNGSGNQLLATWCQTYLELSFQSEARHGLNDAILRTVPSTTGQNLPATSLSIVLPLFSYALDGVLLHGEQAARFGATVPSSFESIVCHRLWLGMKGILKRFTSPPSLLHVLTHERCTSLINQDLARRSHNELQRYINEPFLNNSPLGDMRGTALQIAVARHYPDVVELLLETGAPVNTSCAGASHPLHIAISHHTWVTKHEDMAIIRKLLYYGADVKAESNDGETVLSAAMRTSNDIVEMLLESGADIQAKDSHGDSVLHTAIKSKDTRSVENSIRLGADVNAMNAKAEHVLHTAARSGAPFPMFDALLQSGAAIDAQDAVGDTALHLAVQTHRTGMVKQCMSHGADVNARNKYGETTLHHAARTGNLGIIALVLEYGADIDGCNNSGQSSLHKAARGDRVEIVELLLREGANIETRDEDGKTPLDVAVMSGNATIVKILLSHGANWYDGDVEVDKDMHFAAAADHAVTAKLLRHFTSVSTETRSEALYGLEDEAWWQSYIAADDEEQRWWAFGDISRNSTPIDDAKAPGPIQCWSDDLGGLIASSEVEGRSGRMEARPQTSMGLVSGAHTTVLTTRTRRSKSENNIHTHMKPPHF